MFISAEIDEGLDAGFKLLFTGFADMAFIFDADDNLVAANASAVEKLNYSENEWSTLKIGAICKNVSVEKLQSEIKKTGTCHLNSTCFLPEPTSTELTIQKLDHQGNDLYLMITKPTVNSRNEVIPGKKELSHRLIRELKQQEATITSIFQAAPIGMGTLIDREFTHVNDEFCKMTGYNRLELLGKKSRILYPSQEIYEEIGKILYDEYNAVGSIETVFKKKKGELIDVHITTSIYDTEDNKNMVVFTVTDVTEFNKTQRQLLKSEKRMANLLGNLQGTVYRCKYNGKLLMEYVSDSIEKLTGYAKQDFINNKNIAYFNLIHPEDKPYVTDYIKDLINSRDHFNLEYRIKDKFHNLKWVSEQGKIITEENGEIYLEGYINEITKRKLAEEKIQHHLDELSFLSEAATLMLGISSFDDMFRFISIKIGELVKNSIVLVLGHDKATGLMELRHYSGINKNLSKVINLLGQEPKGMKFSVSEKGIEALTSKHLEKGPESLYELSEKKIPKPVTSAIESIIRLKEIHLMGILHDQIFLGEIVILLRKGGTIENKNLLETFLNQAAIALMKIQTEESLRSSEESLRLATKAAQQGLWDLDLTAKTAYTNDTFFTMLGFEPVKDGFTIDDWKNMLHPEDRLKAEDHFRQYLNGEIPEYNTEFRLQKENGDWSWIISSGEIIKRDDNGKPLRMVGTHTDVTRLKQIELELLEKNQEIERQNEEYLVINEELSESMERVQEINKEFQMAKEKAEESDKLKSSFLANMSHEIRTPMNGIIGFSRMLSDENISEEKKQTFTNIIIESSEQLLSIVNDILDISKIETGQVTIHSEEFNINDVILELFSELKPRATDKGIFLLPDKGLSDRESQVSGDKAKLQQILNNLLSNALKFTHQGQIKFGYTKADDKIVFFVEDTGIGIPDDMHDKIFERFRQADATLNRQYGGTGLGLAISKNLVELMDGKIWLESKPEKGTTFYFTLPYNPVHVPETENLKETNTSGNGKSTILIAEDEEINFLFLEELLNGLNLKILHAKNGLEAVEMCEQNPDIDLVLMDIKMPEMNGLEATQTIKRKRKNLPIVAQTAYAMESDKEKALETGCDGYLSKPINKDELITLIQTLIKKSP